ncbi:hypothetical protein FQA39_LY04198 [Lamprigera yunnana]|nr:hypothetical protein FQA39_LY04198 [Lamprigera yunnana]
MTNVDEKTRRAALVSKVIEVFEQLNIKLRSRKLLGHNDTVSFLISDGSDDGQETYTEDLSQHENEVMNIDERGSSKQGVTNFVCPQGSQKKRGRAGSSLVESNIA